jgi:secreted PhoX family phosphatase
MDLRLTEGVDMPAMDRRAFLGVGAGAALGGTMLSAAALERLTARSALAATGSGRGLKARAAASVEGYGPVQPMADQRGVEVLALPAGFSYVTFGYIGDRMSDRRATPLALDGMAAFAGPNGTVRLIRNHEDRNPPGEGSLRAAPRHMYDAEAGGGTTTLDFNPRTRRLARSFVSLAGRRSTARAASRTAIAVGSAARRRSADRTTPRRPCVSRAATATAISSRSTAVPGICAGPSRSGPWGASPTRRSPSTSAPASST